ncbi:putative hydrocarbon binding protein [Bacillus capparidis]|uniref:Hydrocarbon binding protein n=1 Tax=Bacillus capparidis TaxID=1840411 RepID=A0ABS4D0X2_9BACI|nr:putative hydrocarbon binding protein [Bacillus capparidis]
MSNYETKIEKFKEMEVSAFAYELIKEVLIPDLLGSEYPSMMYWAGKNIARKFPLDSWNDIPAFFQEAGWGNLVLVEAKKNRIEFTLDGPLVSNRLKHQKEPNFQLEAGFIAEQIQMLNNNIAESYEQIKKRTDKVELTVKWDLKDRV